MNTPINTNPVASMAMLVRSCVTFFAGSKTDKKQSTKITEEENLSEGTAKVIKNLFAKGDLAGLRAVRAKVLAQVWLHTLPWDDRGYRLLPAKIYSKFQTEMMGFNEEFQGEVAKLQAQYANILAERKWELKGLFNPSDYPTVEELPNRYKINISYSAIPDTANFKIDMLNPAQQAEAKEEVENTVKAQVQGAMKESMFRLVEGLAHLAERLDYSEGEEKKIFRDSTIQNLKDLFSVADEMNFTDCPLVAESIRKAKELIEPAELNPENLRTNGDARKVTCSRLQKTVADMTATFEGIL